MVLKAIQRALSTWDTFRAEKKYSAGDYTAAWTFIDRAVARTGTEVLDPYIFRYQYQTKKGELVEGLETRRIIENELDSRSNMQKEEVNYIKYFLLTMLPDDYLTNCPKTNIVDPKKLGLEKVHTYVRAKYPYRVPTKVQKKLLQGN